jgi:hypothetical protein
LVLDQNGLPFNIGGDYNLDGVYNDHPNFIGTSLGSVYSGGSPANGIFIDNNQIGCGFPGMSAAIANVSACNANYGVGTPSTLFGNPAYPSGSTPYERFGTLGRGVFHGPRFQQMDMSLSKTFNLTERLKFRVQANAQNLLNHPSFDCVQSNLRNTRFGQARCLTQSVQGLGAPIARVMSIGGRFSF